MIFSYKHFFENLNIHKKFHRIFMFTIFQKQLKIFELFSQICKLFIDHLHLEKNQ